MTALFAAHEPRRRDVLAMSTPFKIAVGSTNPTKVEAVRRILSQAYPGSEVIGLNVLSGVPEQPIGDGETRRGAINRARAALEAAQADLALGLEGGVVFTPQGAFTMGWAAIVDRHGQVGLSQSPWLQLPPEVADAIRAGGELGPVMDQLTGEMDTKKHGGAVGVLTQGLFDRRASWELSVACALAPFLNPDLYQGTRR